jgi:flagellum-specific peptidoglycan hydrolase FlgJ
MTGSASLLPNEVPPTRTPVTPEQMYQALQSAWPSVIGGTPSRQSLLVLLSQWSLETGNGASMVQFNVGNFKAPHKGSDGGVFCQFMTTEVENGVTVHVSQPFAAYPDLVSGVTAYLSAMHGRFGGAWAYVLSGNLDGFAQALKDQGYYTASESSYAAGLEARYATLNSQIA